MEENLNKTVSKKTLQNVAPKTSSNAFVAPGNSRLTEVVEFLKQCKREGLSYYNATEFLEQKGYTAEEVQQASYQFVYNDPLSTEHILSSSEQESGPISKQIEYEINSETAKTKVNRDFWMGTVPIVGGFYRYKRIGDIINYESLKTGRSKIVIFGIWLFVDILAFIGCLLVPYIIFHVGYLKDNQISGLLLPYIIIALAFLLFRLFIRKPRS